MLNLEQAPLEVVARQRDTRMTLPSRPGEAPLEGLLGRRAFALVPWIVVSAAALAYAIGEVIRHHDSGLSLPVFGGALAVAAIAGGLALIHDTAIGRRYRRALWVYAVSGVVLVGVIATVAAADVGAASVVFAGAGPVATYLALVAPPSWRSRALAVFVVATVAVQVVNAQTGWFDLVIVWSLILAAWASGVLVSVGHARTAKITRRLGAYDAATRSLSRRSFMEQLEFAMSPAGEVGRPIGLLLIGVDLARAPELPAQDGARLLEWVGTAVSAVLPPTAEFGRIGDQELGVLLSDVSRHEAEEIGWEIERALSLRFPTTVGVATSETRDLAAADLFRVADAARAMAQRERRGVHALVAGAVVAATVSSAPAPRPTLRYADMRATGKVPRLVEASVLGRRIVAMSGLVVAAAGLPIVVRGMVDGGTGFAADLVRYGGVPWLIWVLSLAEASRRWANRGNFRVDAFLLLNAAMSLPIGVGCAALASGGLVSPILAALFVSALFTSSIHSRGQAIVIFLPIVAAWGVVALLSPADTLWAAPFQLMLLLGSFALGSTARVAMDETADHARSRAFTDDLTQFTNRAGFVHFAEDAFYRSVTSTGQPFALITFELEGLRAYNEANGYAAGDALLRTIADLLEERIPAYYVIGRTGATRFSAAVAVGGAHAASGLAHDLCVAIGQLTSVRAGCATCPADGATLAALMANAEAAARPRRAVLA